MHPIPGVGDREAVLTQQPLIDLDLALVSVMPFFVERFDLAGLTGVTAPKLLIDVSVLSAGSTSQPNIGRLQRTERRERIPFCCWCTALTVAAADFASARLERRITSRLVLISA